MAEKKLLTKEELLKKYKGKYVRAFPVTTGELEPNGRRYKIYFEVKGSSKNYKEHYKLAEELVNEWTFNN
jgi:hypothetical protein